MTPASFGRRFAGLFVDWILCLLVAGLFGPLNGSVWPVVVLIVQHTFFVGLFGQTPGMFVVRLRCVEPDSGRPIGLPRAALRAVLLVLLVPPLIMDADGRGLHDRAAGSAVTRLAALPPVG